jgi:hypothetical protein
MSEAMHKVVLYVNEQGKRFTITARMDRARLAGVDEQMAQPGYMRIEVAGGLEKKRAEEVRDRERAAWEAKGYTYQPRPHLS